MKTTNSTNKTATMRQNQAFDGFTDTILDIVRTDVKTTLKSSVTKAADWLNLPSSEFRILRSLKTMQMLGKGVTENTPMITLIFAT